MILRMLTLMLMLVGSLTAPLFAGADMTGAAAVQEIPGMSSALGVLEYSDFYALQGTDNSPLGTAGGIAVQFPRNGSTTGTITRTGSSTFLLPAIGTYLVQFQVDVAGAAQLQLKLNTVPLPDTVVGRATGQTQIIGLSLVTTVTPNSVLEVINPPANETLHVASGTVPPSQSGHNPVSAHLVIVQIQ